MRHRRSGAAAGTLALTLGLALATGCVGPMMGGVAAVGGAGGWGKNAVQTEYGADLERTWQAALGALEDYGYAAPPDASHTATAGEVAVRDVWVGVESVSATATRVP